MLFIFRHIVLELLPLTTMAITGTINYNNNRTDVLIVEPDILNHYAGDQWCYIYHIILNQLCHLLRLWT